MHNYTMHSFRLVINIHNYSNALPPHKVKKESLGLGNTMIQTESIKFKVATC